MKLYSVHFEVSIREIGPLEEPEPTPEEKPLAEGLDKNSPIADISQLFDRMVAKGIFGGASPFPPPSRRHRRGRAFVVGPDAGLISDGMSINETVETTAGSFEELQGILQKFHAVAAALSTDAQLNNLAK